MNNEPVLEKVAVGWLLLALLLVLVATVLLYRHASRGTANVSDTISVEESRQRVSEIRILTHENAAQFEKLVVRRGMMVSQVVQALDGVELERVADPSLEMEFTSVRYDMLRTVYLLAALVLEKPLYNESVLTLLGRLVEKDKKEFGNAAKVASATYRMAEMSGTWAASLGVSTSDIQRVFGEMKMVDSRLKVAHYQIINGLYRSAELLALAAKQLGVESAQADEIIAEMKRVETQTTDTMLRMKNGLESVNKILQQIEPLVKEGSKTQESRSSSRE